MSEYIGNRIVPHHDGVWDKTKEYEPLTIVYEEATGDSYISRKPVPAGTLLSQEKYWAMCSRFSEQMALHRKKTAQDVADITKKVDATNSAVAANKAEMDKTAETLKAQIDANVKASTDKNANYAQELVDARVDDTGKTYGTAGDNVRAIGRVRSMQDVMKNWYLNAGYVNKNGYITASESWRVAHLIPVSGDSILVTGQFGYMSGSDEYNNVVCYDMDRKFLGGCFRAENNKVYDNYVITLLPNTRFISITTSEKLLPKLSVYLYDNMLPLNLLSNYATSWQWMNGSVDIRFTGSKVTVTFPEGKNVYVCRRPNGTQYEQTLLTDASSISVDFSTKKWWAVYYDGKEVSADESGTKIEVPVIRVANTDGDWGKLFTRNRFVFAVFYDGNVVYAAPSNNGTVINGIDYGNPAKIAYNAVTQHKYRSAKMFLSTGQLMIDTVNRTISGHADPKRKGGGMPRRYKQGADGQPHPAFYGKLPEEFSKADTMRFMVETDLKLSGCVSADTLAALRAEGYDYKDGNLVPAGKEETMQEKVANTTPAAPLKLDVSVRVIEPVKNLMGFASVKFNDCFVVENLKIVQGSKGLFLGMPSQPDGKGGYRDMAYPVTKEFREQLNTAVLQAYEAKLEQMAERGSVGRASISDQLKAGKAAAEQAKAERPPKEKPSRSAER